MFRNPSSSCIFSHVAWLMTTWHMRTIMTWLGPYASDSGICFAISSAQCWTNENGKTTSANSPFYRQPSFKSAIFYLLFITITWSPVTNTTALVFPSFNALWVKPSNRALSCGQLGWCIFFVFGTNFIQVLDWCIWTKFWYVTQSQMKCENNFHFLFIKWM